MKKKKYVQICPRCGSTDIHVDFQNPAVWVYGTPVKYQCGKCGYNAPVFPKVPQGDVQSYRTKIPENVKKKHKAIANAPIIDAQSGFTGGVLEIVALLLAGSLIFLGYMSRGSFWGGFYVLVSLGLIVALLRMRKY